jgi:hypothetical protein
MAKLDDIVIYEGAIPSRPSTDKPSISMANITNVMFTTTIDSSFTGEKRFSIIPLNGWVVVGDVTANYFTVPNPIYTAEELAMLVNIQSYSQIIAVMAPHAVPPFTDAELAILGSAAPENASARTAIYFSRDLTPGIATVDTWGRIYSSPDSVFSDITITEFDGLTELSVTAIAPNCYAIKDGVEQLAETYSGGTLPHFLHGNQQMRAALNITPTRRWWAY